MNENPAAGQGEPPLSAGSGVPAPGDPIAEDHPAPQTDPALPSSAAPSADPSAHVDPAASETQAPPVVPIPVSDDGTVRTENERLRDGVNRCPRCGSTEVQFRPETGKLICLFCRFEWSEDAIEGQVFAEQPLSELSGTVIGGGAGDIDASVSEIVTMKCGGCGSEVVVNTAQAMSARCHWCRHVLTVNEQVPNGAVPDAVLPFSLTHDQALVAIQAFAGKRRMFANRRFLREFRPENVVGVYLPYMVVDGNASADVWGQGEVLIRSYTRGTDENKRTYYDADVYQVQRHVDFTVDDLTIESSSERANMDTFVNTNNVINTILPFDTKNAVRWNASYLNGFTSEKRDTDVSGLQPVLEQQLLSIARSEVAPSVSAYDRGVRWEQERLEVRGTRWLSMYLPVWLYSYYQDYGGEKMVHYIAVNGRTGETMGSVPVSRGRLLAAAFASGTVIEALVIGFLAVTA